MFFLTAISLSIGEHTWQNLNWSITGQNLMITVLFLTVMILINRKISQDYKEEKRFYGNTFLVFLFLAFAAFTEELLFRGVVQHEYGLTVASIVFGLVHCKDVAYFVFASIIGLMIGTAYHITDSISVPILIHVFHNWIVFFLSKSFDNNNYDLDLR